MPFLVALILLGLWMRSREMPTSVPEYASPADTVSHGDNGEHPLNRQWSQGRCEGQGPVTFGASPLDVQDLEMITPLGLMVDAHVTPSDHTYITPVKRDTLVPVHAPARGFIVAIQRMTQYIGDRRPTKPVDDYRIIFEHSCDMYSYFIHVDQLAPRVASAAGDLSRPGENPVRIPVAEGDVIGSVDGSFDFAAIDLTTTLSGFIVPEHYVREPWKIHTVDPFPRFQEPVQSALLARIPRTAEPRGGKIDYDIDGKLVGNWFREGTNGYAGNDPQRYWSGHLSLVYDLFDPTQIRVSHGDVEGRAQQFGVRGDAPDPATVDMNSGPVAYELVMYTYETATGTPWNRTAFAADVRGVNMTQLQGTILVQLIAPRRLRVEVFPGKSAEQISGFTSAAQIYER